MTAPLLLDTCAVIWAANDSDAPQLRDALDMAWRQGVAVWISPITAWELGNLTAAGRLHLARPALTWFEELTERTGANLAELSARILVASTALPEPLHRDPADRIIIATARELGLRVVTRDAKILDYAAQGHVMALPC